jgi:DNA-binding transcriptional regulator GbsR (MarR family)
VLTIGERIIIHLSQFSRLRDQYQCPIETTQNGISEAIDISRAHVAIELKRLKSNGDLDEKAAHVEKAKTKRKVYFLTISGEEKARNMRSFAKEKKVRLLEPKKGIAEVTGDTAIRRLKKLGLPENRALELVLQLDEIDPLAYEAMLEPQKKRGIRPPPSFFGRTEELKKMDDWLHGDSRFFAVMGMTGIGKTTLAEKFCSELDSEIFWHRTYETDSSTTLVKALGAFLASLGKKRLNSYLGQAITPDFKDVIGILENDLKGLLLVVDDSHRSKDIERFLSLLKEGDMETKVLVNSSKKPGFYNRSDVVVNGLVEEMYMRGLDKGASKELLKVRGFAFTKSSFGKLYELTKGHPTALMLMASRDYSGSYRDFLRYLNEEVLGDLTTEEEGLLRELCVFRGAFAHELIKDSDTITLHRLMRKSLVQDRGDDLAVPELVADYFRNHLEKGERKSHHSAAADYYLQRKDDFERLYHLVRADREFEAVSLALRKKDEFMARPEDFHELIRNLRPKDKYAPNFNLLKKTVQKRLERQ